MSFYSLLLKTARKYLLTGIGVLFPLFVSSYVIYLMFGLSERFAGRFINAYLKENYGFIIPGLGFFIILAVLIAAGLIATHLIGRKPFHFFERILMKLPLVGTLYPSAKQLSAFLFKGRQHKEFKKVVLVEFPYKGAYSIGFITNQELGVINKAAKQELINIFMPLAPAPFSGFLLLLPREKIISLDISFETAIKYIVSGGVVFEPRSP